MGFLLRFFKGGRVISYKGVIIPKLCSMKQYDLFEVKGMRNARMFEIMFVQFPTGKVVKLNEIIVRSMRQNFPCSHPKLENIWPSTTSTFFISISNSLSNSGNFSFGPKTKLPWTPNSLIPIIRGIKYVLPRISLLMR